MNADFEARFYEFLHARGYVSHEVNYDHLGVYCEVFTPGSVVLDVGCGQGDFMELLRERGCIPLGVDSDWRMVEQCRAKGLAVHLGDAAEYLRTCDASFDGIFTSNVIEHFPSRYVVELFALAFRALKPGGRFLVATPNPESLIVHLHEYWRDATHARLYNRQLIEFIMVYSGFEIVSSGVNTATAWIPPLPDLQLPDIAQVNTKPPVQSDATRAQPSGADHPVLENTVWTSGMPISDKVLTAPTAKRDASGHAEPALVASRDVEPQPASRAIRRPVDHLLGLDTVRESIALVIAQVDQMMGDLKSLDARDQYLTDQVRALDERTQSLQDRTQMLAENERSLTDSLAALEAHEHRLNEYAQSLAEAGHRIAEVTRSLREAVLFLFPPREIFVVGRRPDGSSA